MLNEDILNKLSERLVNRVNNVNTYTLSLIAKRIGEIGKLLPSDAQKLVQELRYGDDLDNIINEISKMTNLNVQDIYDIFNEVAKKDLTFAKQFYDYKNKPFVTFENNPFLQQQIKAIAKTTANEYFNISKTLGFAKLDSNGKVIYNSIAKTYQDTLDEAILSLTQGKDTYEGQMARVIKELSSSGIKTIDYANGYSKRLDSAVRMNIMDGMRQVHNSMQETIGEDIGYDGIEISVHANPAPDHADIQGHQYTIEEFNKLNNELERPISTMNCYHYIFSIVLGVSKPQYSQEQLNTINTNNLKGFELDGNKYTMYEGTQLQRQLETKIREQKDIKDMAKISNNKQLYSDTDKNITELLYKYNQLSKISGLPTKIQRLKNYK